MIELHTLGDAVIKVGDREIRPTSPAMFAALLYLGVERGQRVPRAALQELLFPDADERSGSHSLRQLLYKLRQLGAPIQSEGDVVWIESHDVCDDYASPKVVNGAEQLGSAQRSQFLPRYVAPSPAFDEWLEARRFEMSTARRRALLAKMLACRDSADWASVDRFASEVLATDEFNEEATMALAESLALSGSKTTAVRMLERYENETGRADLRLPASVLRRRITERLPERGWVVAAPFRGRERETQILRESVLNLRQRRGQIVAVCGEPGIGKTRLLEETASLASLEGITIHTVRCQPHYSQRPMGIFFDWVPQLLATPGALGVAPESLAVLKGLTGRIRQSAVTEGSSGDDATKSAILTTALRDLIEAVSAETPVMLCLDDAQWADPTSMRDLATIVGEAGSRALLVAMTTRSVDGLRESGLLTERATCVRLHPIDEPTMRELCSHLLGHASKRTTEAEEWCIRTATGNPFYLQVLCAHLQETGRPFELPPSVRLATARRIELLGNAARGLLELCVLLEKHASIELLEALSDVDSEQFAHALRELEEYGLVGSGTNTGIVVHDIVRESLVENIPTLSLQLLHARVADCLEKEFELRQNADLLWDCATHWAASGRRSRAIAATRRCADHACEIGRTAHAVMLLQTASGWAAGLPEHQDVLVQLAQCARNSGMWHEVLRAADDYCAISASLEPELPINLELCRLEACWSLRLELDGSEARLLEHLARGSLTTTVRAHAAGLLVRIGHETHRPDLAQKAFAFVRDELDCNAIDAHSRLLLLMYHTTYGDLEIARSTANELERDLDRFSTAERLRLARNLAVAFCTLSEPAKSQQICEKFSAIAEQLDVLPWQYSFAASCACALTDQEQSIAADLWYMRAEAYRARLPLSIIDFVHLATGVDIALQMRDAEIARARLEALKALSNIPERIRFVIRGQELLVSQLDPAYKSSETELEQLGEMIRASRSFDYGEALAEAYCEALARNGDGHLAQVVAQSHLRKSRTGANRRLAAFASRTVAV